MWRTYRPDNHYSAGPFRWSISDWPAVVEGCVEARRAGDSIKHGAVAAHFCDHLQAFHAGHHFITTVRRITAAGVNHVLPGLSGTVAAGPSIAMVSPVL